MDTKQILFNALKAILEETDGPHKRMISQGSFLPYKLIDAARKAIARAEVEE